MNHVTTWMEAVGNVFRLFKSENQRHVLTGVKGNNCFTTRISILKYEKKNFVFWKGKPQKQGPPHNKKTIT